jgi:hypothetical protein
MEMIFYRLQTEEFDFDDLDDEVYKLQMIGNWRR